MSPTDVKPSPRLVRAAVAEREEIHRQRERLQERRAVVLDELAKLDRALAQLDERELLLDRLAPVQAGDGADKATALNGSAARGTAVQPVADVDATGSGNDNGKGSRNGHATHAATTDNDANAEAARGAADDDWHELRGPAIRKTAVRILVERGGVEAMYYRDWFKLLTDAGYSVRGRDPVAVFLTQISRSPAVRRTTRAGVYALDFDAPGRLSQELGRLHAKLREVTAGSPAGVDLPAIRAHREKLVGTIGQVERALEEVEWLLGRTRADSALDAAVA